jgi:hypothetical protein
MNFEAQLQWSQKDCQVIYINGHLEHHSTKTLREKRYRGEYINMHLVCPSKERLLR